MNSIDQLFSGKKEKQREEGFCYQENSNRALQKINAGTILIPIVLFEILVCILGAKFYIAIGYKAYSALILAISIEVFYMYFSSKRNIKSTIIKSLLLSISVTTLSYSAYIKDKNIKIKTDLLTSTINDNKSRLTEVNLELSLLKNEKLQINKDMELFREFKKATKGNLILAPRRKELKLKRLNLLSERNSLKDSIGVSGETLIKQNIISNITILSIQTIISILAFTVVQISICTALPDILNKLEKNKK